MQPQSNVSGAITPRVQDNKKKRHSMTVQKSAGKCLLLAGAHDEESKEESKVGQSARTATK